MLGMVRHCLRLVSLLMLFVCLLFLRNIGTGELIQSRLLDRNVSAFLIRGLPFYFTVRGSYTRLTGAIQTSMIGRAKRSVKMLLVNKPLHCLRKSADLPSRPSCTRCIYTGRLTQIPNGELHRFLVSSARRAEVAFIEVTSQGPAMRYEG